MCTEFIGPSTHTHTHTHTELSTAITSTPAYKIQLPKRLSTGNLHLDSHIIPGPFDNIHGAVGIVIPGIVMVPILCLIPFRHISQISSGVRPATYLSPLPVSLLVATHLLVLDRSEK